MVEVDGARPTSDAGDHRGNTGRPPTDRAAARNPNTMLRRKTRVTTYAQDGDNARAGCLNDGTIDVDADEVAGRRRRLLVGLQGQIAVDRGHCGC